MMVSTPHAAIRGFAAELSSSFRTTDLSLDAGP